MRARSVLHEQALEYARLGWYVFPLNPGAKTPLGALVKHGKDNATIDNTVINSWWEQYPDANIGIACEPSELVVLDVDVKPHPKTGIPYRGMESLSEIDNQLTDTLVARTPSNGLHIIYKADDGERLQRLGFKEGLDLIGKGYFVAAPSRVGDKKYEVISVRVPAPLPPGLRQAATIQKTVDRTAVDKRAPLPPGGRNIALYRLAAHMIDNGLGRSAVINALYYENQERCIPPLDDTELRAIVDSAFTRVVATRDIAAGAAIADEIRSIVAPKVETPSSWIYEVIHDPPPPTRFFTTGFDHLDMFTGGGLASRQVMGIIGPPSVGKSAFVGSVVAHVQKQSAVLHISTELPKHEVAIRYAAAKLAVPWRDGIKGLIPMERQLEATRGLRVRIIGSDNVDRVDPLAQFRREAQMMQAVDGTAPIIVLDYVQMLARGNDDIRSKVGEITMGLRILSQELDTAIMAVFSTGREFYREDRLQKLRELNDPTAYLAAAKESGDIEFDCATVIFLDLDRTHEGQPKPARIPIARCRVGDIGFAGARARLDHGVWWGDEKAADEMSPDNMESRNKGSGHQKDQVKLYNAVAQFTGRPFREICMNAGLSDAKGKLARAALIEQGKVEFVRETSYDNMHRGKTVETLKIKGTKVTVENVSPTENAEGAADEDFQQPR